MFNVDSIVQLLDRKDIHISSHVEILKADLPNGKSLTLKIEAPTRAIRRAKAQAEAKLNK